MASLTSRILNSIQKLGCDCSAICKTCVHLSVPAADAPCNGCKYGSLGGKKDNYSKQGAAKNNLKNKTIKGRSVEEVPEESKDSEMSYGGSGNVSNTPATRGEKRAWDKDSFLSALLNGLNSDGN